MRRFARLALFVSGLCAPVPSALAQCHEWSHDFALSGFDGAVLSYASFDDGHGPARPVRRAQMCSDCDQGRDGRQDQQR